MKAMKLFKYGFMAACLVSNLTNNANAMDAEKEDKKDIAFIKTTKKPKSLVIGCRPWDENLQGHNLSLTNVHFVDFYIHKYEYNDSGLVRSYVPKPDHISSVFHHLDFNDTIHEESETCKGPFAGKFSQFAKENPGEFHDIIIDWATWQHIRRDDAWNDLATLLAPGRTLVIPIFNMTTIDWKTCVSKAQEKAETLKEKIAPLFSNVTISSYEALREQNQTYQALPWKKKLNMTDVSLLCRPYTCEDAKEYPPAIIFATK